MCVRACEWVFTLLPPSPPSTYPPHLSPVVQGFDEREENDKLVRNGVEYISGYVTQNIANLLPRTMPSRQRRRMIEAMTNAAIKSTMEETHNTSTASGESDLIAKLKAAGRAPIGLSTRWVPCVSPEMSDMYRRLGLPSDKPCWGCSTGAATVVKSSKSKWDEMTELFINNVGKRRNCELAEELARWFEDNIRTPANKHCGPGQTPVPPWPPVDLYEHMTRHTNDPRIRLALTISALNRMGDDFLAAGVYRHNAAMPGIAAPDAAAMKSLCELTKVTFALYQQKPENMLLGSPSNNAPLVSSWINMNKPSHVGRHPLYCGTSVS